MFGAMISATDPVAVVALLKEVSHHHLHSSRSILVLRWVRPRDWVLSLKESRSSMTERLSCSSYSLET